MVSIILGMALTMIPAVGDQPAPAASDHGVAVLAQAGDASGRAARRRRVLPPYAVAEVKEGGSIRGVVTFKAAAPPPRRIQIVKDHETCGKHPTEVPVIKVDEQGRVGEAVVYLSDITSGRAPDKRDKPPRIDQSTCEFAPHVQVVIAREPVEILNSDPVAHNIKADQGVATLFNVLQPSKGMKSTKTFDRPGLVELKCNVHDWMRAYVWVLPHPYHCVTGDDGAFTISDVPPGKYTLTVWQETLGEESIPVEVSAGKATEVAVELKPRS